MRKLITRLPGSLATALLFLAQIALAQNCPSGKIGGHVFLDFNFNGIADELSTTGIAGVEVLLFKENPGNGSTADGSTTTDANGDFAFTGKTDGAKYRVELVLPPSLAGLKPTFFGTGNGTSVQFVTAPNCAVNGAFAAPGDFCSANPFMATPCYVNGTPNGGGDAGGLPALIGFPYSATGGGQMFNTKLDSVHNVGSCWGMAYQRESKLLFSAAVLRRHSGFGPGGPGAIYVHDVSTVGTTAPIAAINLVSLGLPIAADPRILNPLPPNIINPSYDSLAFPLIGKYGLGDIDLSADGKNLWVMCLSNRTLYKIFINNPFVMPTAADVTAFPLTNPGCGNDQDWRPWGLKVHRGEVYVGIVCTAESTQLGTGLEAFVKKLNGMGGFDPVFNFPINYVRGAIKTGDAMNKWNPWTNNWATITASGNANYPQPLLSDIEFDIDGSMILGFLDRTAMQGGYLNYGPGSSYNFPQTTFSGGDIVRVCKNALGGFDLEGSTAVCKTPLGMANGEGPGGGEFYWDDSFENSFSNPNTPFLVHHETALGGLALVPGKGEVVSGVYDPLGFNEGGVSWYNNTTGKCGHSYSIYPALPGYSGKSAGVGDVEALCPPAPIEKGNFVWLDMNADGIQDPGEPPLDDVNVSLYDIDCQLIKTVQTDSKGEYYFNKTTIASGDSIQPGATYYIVVGTGGQFTGGQLLGQYELAPANAGSGPDADFIDSDGVIDPQGCVGDYPAIKFTATSTGADHACDFGFIIGCQVKVDAVVVKNETCLGTKDGSLTITASGAANLEYSNTGGGSFQPTGVFQNLMPGNYSIVVREVGNPDCNDATSRTILPGIVVAPPSPVNGYAVCQSEPVQQGGGLTATCGTCPTGYAQTVTWWNTPTGGMQVGTGSPFDPVSVGQVNNNIPGATTFYAQCECGPCVSTRKPAVFTVWPLPVTFVTGEKFPCPGSTHTYSSPYHNGSTWAWSVPTGGIVLSQNQNTLVVKWNATPGGPYLVVVKETDEHGCSMNDALTVNIRPTAIVCKSHLNISLDETCTANLTAEMLLDGDYPTFQGFAISLTDEKGNPFPGSKITGKGLWKFKVTEPCIGNSCWGDIKTEDKFPPKLVCTDKTLPCSQSDVSPVIPDLTGMPALVSIGGLGGVTVEDNCAIISISYSDVLTDYDCAATNGLSARIARTWVATDMSEITGSCIQYINFTRKVVADVVFPPDFTTNICENKDLPPTQSGVPTIDGNPIWPTSAYCELNAIYSDQLFPICDGSLKVIRTWTVLDWCLPISATNPKNFIQIIKYLDKAGPSFTCPPNQTVSVVPNDCSANIKLPDVVATDNCSRIHSAVVRWTGDNGVTSTLPGSLVGFPGSDPAANDTLAVMPTLNGFPLGAHTFTYILEDDCGNTSKCSFVIVVKDEKPPIAICQEFTQVALGLDGVAVANAESFDAGSYDFCSPVYFKVKRMWDSDCVPAAENQFDDQTKFCCSDVNDTVLVILRVYQDKVPDGPVPDDLLEGLFNDCMVQVFVEDKYKPLCTPPGSVTVECAAFDPTLWSYGTAVGLDNCNIDTILYSVNTNQFNNACKSGILTRTWTVRDEGGNTSKCSQKVTVVPKTDFTVKFPDDVQLNDCAATGDYGSPVITGENCEIIAINFDDKIFTLQTDACFKIFRTWTIINWCDYDPNWQPLEIDNPQNSSIGATAYGTDINHGYLRYTQVIKVQDAVDPVIVCPASPVVFNDFTDNDPALFNFGGKDLCEGLAPISVKGHDKCAGANLQIGYILKLDLDGDGQMETTWNSNQPGTPTVETNFDATTGEVTGTLQGLVLPYGNHLVKWLVEDGCGNLASCEYSFEIKDAKKPTVTCLNGLASNIMQNGMVSLWASDFVQYAVDNCTKPANLAYAVRKTGTGTGFPTSQSILFDCSEIGTQTVEVWAKDAAGNADFCQTYCIVSDNVGACGGTKGAISGAIKTKKDEGVEAVSVKITGSQPGLPSPSIFTGAGGDYNFSALPLGQDYVVTPTKDVNPLNGISTFDLVAMSKHVLNVTPFTTPWQYLAADINHNGQVTTFDVVELRKLILGIYTDFPQNDSWRFVEKDFPFDMSQNPLSQGFKEELSIKNLQSQSSLGDFTAVKVGDVNFDAVPNNLSSAADRSPVGAVVFDLDERGFEAGQMVEIPLRATDLSDVLGWQFTLKFDSEKLDFEGIAPGRLAGLGLENFGLNRLADGILTTSWNGETSGIASGDVLFSLRFSAKKGGFLRKSLQIGSEITAAEGYDRAGGMLDCILRFTMPSGHAAIEASGFELFQNEPNPFSERTTIGFSMTAVGKVSLKIFDALGQLVFEKAGEFGRGRQSFEVSEKEIGGSGLYFYEVRTASGEGAARKLLVRK